MTFQTSRCFSACFRTFPVQIVVISLLIGLISGTVEALIPPASKESCIHNCKFSPQNCRGNDIHFFTRFRSTSIRTHRNASPKTQETPKKEVATNLSYDVVGKTSFRRVPPRSRKWRALKNAMKNVITALGISIEGLTEEEIREDLFNQFDANRDGTLSKQELLARGIELGLLDTLDKNKDGFIDKDEFYSAVGMMNDDTDDECSTNQDLVNELDETLGELEPLERQELRLGGFEPYILVSVLTAQASFEAVGNTEFDWDNISQLTTTTEIVKAVDWYSVGVLLTSVASVICGMYATVIFSLSILYGKTALGMSRDEEYYAFMDRTGLQRFRAFQAFSAGLFLFCVSVVFIVCLQCPQFLRLPVLLLSSVVLYFGREEYDVIMKAAQPIFAPKE